MARPPSHRASAPWMNLYRRSKAMFELTEALQSELEAFDTPTVCNALELVAPKRQGYGYTTEHLFCIRPQLKPIVGIARTARIRSAHPSDMSRDAARKLSDDYYAYID